MGAKEKAEARAKLEMWKERLGKSKTAYSGQKEKMDHREGLYLGSKAMTPVTDNDKTKAGKNREAKHVRNIIAENIESQISSTIPQPKVTARRKQDEQKAILIENMIRNELNRMPFEAMNDMQERTIPIQGGGLFLVEWDNTERTHLTVGDVCVSVVHPKQVIPQDGVYTGIEDMDYCFLELPQTKEYIKRRYGKDVDEESESEPEAKGSEGASSAEDMVTQEIALYRNENGGIGLYSWVNEIELEDLDDYQARRLRRCAKCGALEPVAGMADAVVREFAAAAEPEVAGEAGKAMAQFLSDEFMGGEEKYPAGLPMEKDAETEAEKVEPGACPYCGGTEFVEGVEEYEEVYNEIRTANGNVIPGLTLAVDKNGVPYRKPTKIPFYKPDVYPLILQKNVSVFGRFLGDSDVDKMEDQQNTMNRLSMKILDRLIKAGTRISLPEEANFRVDPEDGEKWYVSAEQKACIDSYDFSGDLQYELVYYNQIYEEARQEIGITDSFQGRQDSTANSGVAKQFAAMQAAGRLESKRIMKDAAYADLFRLIFQFRLAYSDEPRPVVSIDATGETKYDEFNRYDFLEKDEAGEYWWNDQFLFSCDTSAPLANNREKMWENTLNLFQSGAFGDPAATATLVALWTKMELLHYPGAGDTKKYMEAKAKEEAAQQERLMKLQKLRVPQISGSAKVQNPDITQQSSATGG